MILIITGHLAYPLVKEMADKSKKETVVHIAETQVAAFLTPTQIIKEIHEYFEDRLNPSSAGSMTVRKGASDLLSISM